MKKASGTILIGDSVLILPLTPLSTDRIRCLRENKAFNPKLDEGAQERDFCKLCDLALDDVKFLEDRLRRSANRGA